MHCARISTLSTGSSVLSISTQVSRRHISNKQGPMTRVAHGRYPVVESGFNGPAGPSTVRPVRRVRASSHDAEASVDEPDSSEYSLSFLWLDKNLAVAVDQVFGRGHRSPITEYYWWPREDAWESLKDVLDEREKKEWIRSADKIKLLNTLTDVINYWSAEEKPSVRDAISQFPGCLFQG